MKRERGSDSSEGDETKGMPEGKRRKKNDVNKLYGEGKKERRGEGREKGREGRKIERSSVPSSHTFLYIPF